MNNRETVQEVLKGYRLENPNPSYCSKEMHEIMLKCWALDPNQRPSFAELLKYFK